MSEQKILQANGARIPALGFGTYMLQGDACAQAVHNAIEAGYRHIDTAAIYGNEEDVGRGIKLAGVQRDALFVTTKVWYTDAAPADVHRSAEDSLRRLTLSHVDLLLIHWPNPEIPLADTMRALGEVKRRGLTRHVGISNFNAGLVNEAVRLADEPLVTNQCEYHPYLNQGRVREACLEHGLAFTSYCPLGKGELTRDPVIREIAEAHGRSPAQVILRWHVQQPATAAIPKSGNRARISQNFAIFGFELTEDEMRRVSALARPDGRMVRPSWAMFEEAA